MKKLILILSYLVLTGCAEHVQPINYVQRPEQCSNVGRMCSDTSEVCRCERYTDTSHDCAEFCYDPNDPEAVATNNKWRTLFGG